MYTTEIIKASFNNHKTATIIEEVTNAYEKEGFDFIEAIQGSRNQVILVFKQTLADKLNKDMNQTLSTLKTKIHQIIDAVK